MASDERGTKRQCLHCGMKYYDLNRDPVLCPGCKEPYVEPVEPAPRKSRAKADEPVAAAPASTEVETDPNATAAGAEVVSFEEAETEQEDDSNKNIPDVEGVEDIGGEVDNAFIENEDDEDDNDYGVNTAKDEE